MAEGILIFFCLLLGLVVNPLVSGHICNIIYTYTRIYSICIRGHIYLGIYGLFSLAKGGEKC